MARRTVLAVPMPADLDDLLQVLTDVGQGWAAARVELGPVTTDGDTLLVLTASRRRAQRPIPGEEPDEEAEVPQRFSTPDEVRDFFAGTAKFIPGPAHLDDVLAAVHAPVDDHMLPEAVPEKSLARDSDTPASEDDSRFFGGEDDGGPDESEDGIGANRHGVETAAPGGDPGAWLDAFDTAGTTA